jgi:hypothetical protein
MAVIGIGTDCAVSSLRRAVTTTSSIPMAPDSSALDTVGIPIKKTIRMSVQLTRWSLQMSFINLLSPVDAIQATLN